MGNYVTFYLVSVGQIDCQLAVAAGGFAPLLLEAADKILVIGIAQVRSQGFDGQGLIPDQLALGAQQLLAVDESGQRHFAFIAEGARQMTAADVEMFSQHLDGQVGEFRFGDLQYVAEDFCGEILVFHSLSFIYRFI